ncbi:hypothetical protein F0562_010263 [Nyssa sinensis]|uniref:Uncharacterized protein n=1 Tax=Nyssa sinensis TaxID=561372 RepID=A0A5J5A031_9ASTE|nr:hypothetical protein F0562_010263 [Nyssa sinensis]
MGILDELQSTASKLTNRNASDTPSDTNGRQVPNGFGIASAVTKIGDAVGYNGVQKLKGYVPQLDSRDREKIGRILTNIVGIQAYTIVKEGLKDQPPSQAPNGNNKSDLTLVMEEMQAKMEKMQDMNNLKQLNKIPTHCTKGSEPLDELSTEPIKGSAPLKTDTVSRSTRAFNTAMAAWTAAARQAASLARLSSPKSAATTGQAANLIHRRGLAGGGDHHGPPKVNFWQDPMSPSKWKEEHFVILSLTGWGILFFGGYKFFTKGKKDEKEEKVGEGSH